MMTLAPVDDGPRLEVMDGNTNVGDVSPAMNEEYVEVLVISPTLVSVKTEV